MKIEIIIRGGGEREKEMRQRTGSGKRMAWLCLRQLDDDLVGHHRFGWIKVCLPQLCLGCLVNNNGCIPSPFPHALIMVWRCGKGACMCGVSINGGRTSSRRQSTASAECISIRRMWVDLFELWKLTAGRKLRRQRLLACIGFNSHH